VGEITPAGAASRPDWEIVQQFFTSSICAKKQRFLKDKIMDDKMMIIILSFGLARLLYKS